MQIDCIALRYVTLRYVTLGYTTLHYMALHDITLHYIIYITVQYSTLRYVTLRTLHYITLHMLYTTSCTLYLHAITRKSRGKHQTDPNPKIFWVLEVPGIHCKANIEPMTSSEHRHGTCDTCLRESRPVRLKPGLKAAENSWQGASIDPSCLDAVTAIYDANPQSAYFYPKFEASTEENNGFCGKDHRFGFCLIKIEHPNLIQIGFFRNPLN